MDYGSVLNAQWEIPWSLVIQVKSIKALIESISVMVIHFHREGNTLADFLANWVFTYAGEFHYNNVEQLPDKGKPICKFDKAGTINIRRLVQECRVQNSNNCYNR